MTITAIQPFYRAGVLIAAGPTQLSYGADEEGDLVRRGVAAYVGSNPQTGGAGQAFWNPTGTALVDPVTGGDYNPRHNNTIERPIEILSVTSPVPAGNSCTLSVDSSKTWQGRSLLKVNATAASAYINKSWGVREMSWADRDSVNVRFYIEDATTNSPSIILYFDNDNSWTNTRSYALSPNLVRSGWNYFRIRFDSTTAADKAGPLAGWATQGTGASHTLNIRHFRINFVNCQGTTVWLDRVTIGGYERPKVMLMFDNWTWQHDQFVLPLLNRHNFKAGIGVIKGGVGPLMTLDSLNRAYADGHDLMPNDITDRNLSLQTRETVRDGVTGSRDYHLSNGWRRAVTFWQYNNNAYNNMVVEELVAAGFVAARSGDESKRFIFTEEGVDNPLRLGSQPMDGALAADWINRFNRVVEYGCTAIFFLHKLHTKAYAEWRTGTQVGATESVVAYAARVAGSDNGWATYVGADSFSGWFDDFEAGINHLADLVQQNKVDQVGLTEWLVRVGLYRPAS